MAEVTTIFLVSPAWQLMHFFEHAKKVSHINQKQRVFVYKMSYADTFYTDSILQISYPLGKSLICWVFSQRMLFRQVIACFPGIDSCFLDLHKDYGTKWDLPKHRNDTNGIRIKS